MSATISFPHCPSVRRPCLASPHERRYLSAYLSVDVLDSLESCISTIGRYCAQRLDVNMSLTAVGLLWNIADYLKRERDAVLRALYAFHARFGFFRYHYESISVASLSVILRLFF